MNDSSNDRRITDERIEFLDRRVAALKTAPQTAAVAEQLLSAQLTLAYMRRTTAV